MKRFSSFLLALMLLFSLSACGEGGLNLNPGENNEDSDARFGYVGDTLSTEWFDFTVDDAYSCSEYQGYTPEDGNKLVVVTITLKHDWGASVDMWIEDFVIMWDDPDEDSGMEFPIAPGLSDDQFPSEYTLGINATKTGVSVYEVPQEYRDFSIGFMEVFESDTNPDGDEGNTYFVDFTPEER